MNHDDKLASSQLMGPEPSIDFLLGNEDDRRFQKFPRPVDVRVTNLKKESARDRTLTRIASAAAIVSCAVAIGVAFGERENSSEQVEYNSLKNDLDAVILQTKSMQDTLDNLGKVDGILKVGLKDLEKNLTDMNTELSGSSQLLSKQGNTQANLLARTLSTFQILSQHRSRLEALEQ